MFYALSVIIFRIKTVSKCRVKFKMFLLDSWQTTKPTATVAKRNLILTHPTSIQWLYTL